MCPKGELPQKAKPGHTLTISQSLGMPRLRVWVNCFAKLLRLRSFGQRKAKKKKNTEYNPQL